MATFGLEHFVTEFKKSKEGEYTFPSHDIDPKKKMEMEYYVKVCQHLFYLGATGQLYTNGLVTGRSKYGNLRLYQKGQINTDKYKPLVLGKDERGNARQKSFINISWRPDNGYLKTLDQMEGAYQKINYDIEVSAIDPTSDYERKQRVAKMKVEADPGFKQLVAETGITLPEGEDPQFDEVQDIDLYVKAGGLKLKTEIAMQKSINATRQESKFSVLDTMCYRDIMGLGFACIRDYVDYSTSMAMLRYADPDYLLIPRSKYFDFRDITIAGELRCMTIADIRNETTLPEDQLRSIAKNYGWSGQLPADVYYGRMSSYVDGMPYDNIMVWILDASWLSSDLEVYTEKTIEKYGVLQYKKKEHGFKPTAKDEKKGLKANQIRTQYCYKAKWILGTDVCFEYGKDYYQIRKGKEGNRKAVLPYHVVTTGTMSKLERMIGDIDDINILTYKRRNAVAAIPAPPGIIVNKTALENVEFDGSVKSPQYLMNMLLEKGILAVDTTDEFGRATQSIGNVVTSYSTAIFEQFRIFSEQIEEKRRNIQISTGMNDVVDGTSDNQRRLQVEGEAKLEAYNNAMQTEYACMRELIQNAFNNVMMRWQEIVKSQDVELEYVPLDDETIETIKLTADLSKPKFGLKVNIASTYQERQMLLQEIMQMKAQRQQSGSGGISEDTYIMLYRTIKSGNIALAQVMLAKARKEQQKEDMQRSMQLQQQNAQVQMQSGVTMEQEKRKTMFAEYGAKMILEHAKNEGAIRLEVVKADLKDGQLDDEFLRRVAEPIIAGNMSQIQTLQTLIMGEPQQQGQQPMPQGQPQE